MADFFIADKLRGIPLVTSSVNNNNQQAKRKHQDAFEPSIISTSTMAPAPERTTRAHPPQLLQMPAVARGLARRLIADSRQEEPPADEGDEGQRLLFRPLASTAAMIRSRGSTGPPVAATTTARPRGSQPRPWTRQAKTAGQPIQHSFRSQSSRTLGLASVTSTLPPPVRHRAVEASTTPAEPEPVVAQPPPSREPKSEKSGSARSPPQHTPSNVNQNTNDHNKQQQHQQQPSTTSRNQSRTGHQVRSASEFQSSGTRRPGGLPPVGGSSASIGRAGGNQARLSAADAANRSDLALAGPNWYVFSRPDGRVSLFELMVLCSNVMIVSTIVVVILYTWFRSVKKRRLERARGDAEASLAEELAKGQQAASRKLLDLKQISPSPTVLSGERSQSEASKVIAGANLGANQQQQQAERSTPSRPNYAFDDSQIRPMATNQPGQTQKAMAIVQPTEAIAGTSTSSGPSVGGQPSGPRSPLTTMRPQSARASPVHSSEPDANTRTNHPLGHHPLNGSSPNLAAAAAADTKPPPLATSGSLDSIELPENLVQSIKRYDPQPSGLATNKSKPLGGVNQTAKGINDNVGEDKHGDDDDSVPKPSPNLLLEVAKPVVAQVVETESREVVGAVETRKDTESKAMPSTAIDSPKVAEQKTKAITKTNSVGAKQPEAVPGFTASKSGDPASSKGAPAKTKSGKLERQSSKIERQAPPPVDPVRPENPMGRDLMGEDVKPANGGNGVDPLMDTQATATTTTRVENHEIVVNKLDKRKTKLEIVDIRDESVTGKLKKSASGDQASATAADGTTATTDDPNSKWISMDRVAVTQPTQGDIQGAAGAQGAKVEPLVAPTPGSLINSRFKVDYAAAGGGPAAEGAPTSVGGPRQATLQSLVAKKRSILAKGDSIEEQLKLNDIDHELEQDNKLKNRKYFVYIVHDGHFTAKKECIARLELPPAVGSKRRVTLADLRQLIVASQDISLTSLKRNKFKFVTETYRLLNEDEDAAILHQVYPTQGVFLKINISENSDAPYSSYAFSRSPRSSRKPSLGGSSGHRNSGSQRGGLVGEPLPAIEVGEYGTSTTPRGPARSKSGVELASMRRAGAKRGSGGMTRATSSGAADLDDIEPEIDFSTPEKAGKSSSGRRKTLVGASIADMSDSRMRIITPSMYCSRASCGCFAKIRCELCNQGHYCSVQCRIRDWPQHKQFCKRPRWKFSGQR